MSLTSELGDPRSRISRFLRDMLPLIDETKRGSLLEPAAKRLLGFDTIPRTNLLPGPPGTEPSTVGIAVDYRIRHAWRAYSAQDTVAAKGVQALESPAARKLGNAVLLAHDAAVAATADDDVLIRYAILLAYFEAIVRSGMVPPILITLSKTTTVEQLLMKIPQPVVDDVQQLANAFFEDQAECFALPAVLNPKFAGSQDVGGADGDVIVGDMLLDFKATSKADPTALRNVIQQLVGYTLLDYEDVYQIRAIGAAFLRQRAVWLSPIWHLIFPLAEVALVVSGKRPEPSESDVERQLTILRTGFRKIAAGN